MQHTCQDCDHQFSIEGQNEPHVMPAVQCPRCHSYRTQPSGIPDENNDMLHGTNMGMPDSTQDDMSGNPLKEGDSWQNRAVRDESFPGGTYSYKHSLFEVPESDSPEFETTQIIAPPELYSQGMDAEQAHRANIQIPHGITDNLHAALGNLGAWVENPYENGALRPYSNSYWKSIRPQFMKPGSLQIGVADPIMAEIINHVAQNDDLTPLYEYRGKTSSVKVGAVLALPALADLLGGGAAAAGADAAAAGVGDAAAGAAVGDAAAGGGGLGAGAVGSLLKGVGGSALGGLDDLLGGGQQTTLPQQQVNPSSFYGKVASDEDNANPDSHDEIPKNRDGDSKEQTDGNNHEWQRDISVNDGGGSSLHSPQFDAGGPAVKRLMMLAPLLLQYLDSGEDGSNDPMIQGLHQSLEAEIPGYMNHADDHAGQQLIVMLRGKGQPVNENHEGERNEPTHTDENSGGAKESRVASVVYLGGEGGDFLPEMEIEFPSLNGLRTAAPMPMPMPMPGQMPPGGMPMGAGPMPPGPMGAGTPPGPPPPAMPSAPPSPSINDSNQGPVTDEQQAWFSQILQQEGREDEIPKMLADPALYAKEFAEARGREVPPQKQDPPQQDPMPPQEEAPPSDTMPVPPMGGPGAQMQSAVNKYAADSIAGKCPECGSHTTEILDEDGNSHCHACGNIFKTQTGVADKVHPGNTTASTHWNVDTDYRKVADAAANSFDTTLPSGTMDDQQGQHNGQPENQSSGHTWLDEAGNPLVKGQEYEMYTSRFDIPDLVRIEAVKPTSVIYTFTNQDFGLEKSDELTKQEANVEGTSFVSTMKDGEHGPEDEGSLEYNNDDNTGYTGPGARDLSQPDSVMSAVIASGVEKENPALAWLEPESFRTAGANYTPMEQRALIEESGMARNMSSLDLIGTHYLTGNEEDETFLFGW